MTTPALPTPNSSFGTWGTQLNTWLMVAHNANGTAIAPAAFGTVVAPSGDITGSTDTEAINGVVQTAGGGAALLQNGTYYVTNLLPDSYSAIIGSGPGTILQAVAGTTGSMIAWNNPVTTRQVTLNNFTLIPNTGTLIGISADNTGFSQILAGTYDCRHILSGIYVYEAGGDAFYFGNNTRGVEITGCQAYSSIGSGFNLAFCTDCFFTNCVSGASGSHGFTISSVNNLLTGCKAFWSGWNYVTGIWGTTQAGFYLNDCQWTTVTGCSSQQSALHGYDLQGTTQCTVTGCEADTNSAGTSGGVGFNTNSTTGCTIAGCCGSDNTSLLPGAQLYGIQVAGQQPGTVFAFNTVTGANGGLNYVSGGQYTYLATSSMDVSQVWYVKVPSLVLAPDNLQTVTTGGTILTATDGNNAAIPVTAASACTGLILQAPNNPWSQITVINQSAYALTFAVSGTSSVADGASDVIAALTSRSFVYDGNTSLWYRCG